MNTPQRQPVPCHLISGPLGVGKTTTVLRYLQARAGKEFIAVLVNDFGPMGLDDAIIEGEMGEVAGKNAELVMVPGGCICCSAAAGMLVAMQKIFKLPRLDRILIEPSGMAMTGDMLDLLQSLKHDYPLELRPTITLLDIRQTDRLAYQRMPYFYRMFEAADILVGHRADLATPQQVEHFQLWAQSLYPPKLRIIITHHGELPGEVFELKLAQDAASTAPRDLSPVNPQQMFRPVPGHDAPLKPGASPSGVHHQGVVNPGVLNPGAGAEAAFRHTGQAGGVRWDAAMTFDVQVMLDMLHQLVQTGFQGVKIERLKGVLHTDEGWQLLEIARGDVFSRPTDYRRDNRVDWITLEGTVDASAFKSHLLSAARPPVY